MPDEIATELGVLPSYWRLFWRNAILAHRVHYGPNLPVIYRLLGPGAKDFAWKVSILDLLSYIVSFLYALENQGYQKTIIYFSVTVKPIKGGE